MRILGIDPGIGRTGWGAVEAISAKQQVLNYGCIETNVKDTLTERLRYIYEQLNEIIRSTSPDILSIEELFFNTNAKTALTVGQARGVILLAAAQNNLPVAVYTPLQVKMALTGYGRAEKTQIGLMVKTLLKLPAVPKPDDTADALAIALAHSFMYKFPVG